MNQKAAIDPMTYDAATLMEGSCSAVAEALVNLGAEVTPEILEFGSENESLAEFFKELSQRRVSSH